MKKKLRLFIFIDAFGWQILKNHEGFLKDIAVGQNKLKTILGYSSGCDPSIISGKFPCEHLHWSSFYYSPGTCPYKWVSALRFLPKALTNRQRVRGLISKWIKKIHGFTGYFQIYQVPFECLPFFDYAEKRRIWEKGGLWKGQSIFDEWAKEHIIHYVGDQDPEDLQWAKAKKLIEVKAIDCAYLLMGKLDHYMHHYGTRHEIIDEVISQYDSKIRDLIRHAEKFYGDVQWHVFSDHGMHDVKAVYDLQSPINSLGLNYGKDYAAIYDSTMGRFWYFNEKARKKILDCLSAIPSGRILSAEELKALGVLFENQLYGETIFLMNPGVLIIPSFMGLKPIPGMHGYHPDDPDSYAMILSNQQLPQELASIEKIYAILKGNV